MATFTGPSLGPDGWLRDHHLPPNLRPQNLPGYLASEAADPDSPLAGELNATYVRFEDEAGNPLPSRNVVIKVSATTGEIIDIVSEA